MKSTVKYILYASLAGVLLCCMVAAYLAGLQTRRPLVCKDIRVEVLDSTENSFVTAADIRKVIDRSCGRLIGQPLDSIDLTKVEAAVDSRSAVLKSEAFVTRDSILNITVTQRKPVVRFQKNDGGFYADAEGYIFPLQSSYSSHVQIIDGAIPLAANSGYKGDIEDPQERAWFKSVMNVVNFMEGSRTWKGKIVQIHVDRKGELTLVPREGNEIFLFGQPHSVPEKFAKMEKYYTTIIPEKGAKKYKTVDVRFDNQIVCK